MSALRQSPAPEEKWIPGKVVEYVYDQVSSRVRHSTASWDLRDSSEIESMLTDQPVPIPSYLIAIASGELEYRPFKQLEGRKWRSGCWTEPLMMEEAFWEFSEDTARLIDHPVRMYISFGADQIDTSRLRRISPASTDGACTISCSCPSPSLMAVSETVL